jgi:diphthine synthase
VWFPIFDMLYIIGLGLNEKGISLEGCEALKRCKKVYLEGYTVNFPYSVKELQRIVGENRKISVLGRDGVEDSKLVKEGKKDDICLLVYGSPLFATTHMTLISDCKKAKVKVKIVYGASIFDALGSTGLQLYKFGKISSMPKWQKSFTPDSFLDFVIENKKIEAHSLILVDIGLEFKDALEELKVAGKNKKVKLGKIVVCSSLGSDKGKIYYGEIEDLIKKKVKMPYCFIIPGKMHFFEEDVLKGFE